MSCAVVYSGQSIFQVTSLNRLLQLQVSTDFTEIQDLFAVRCDIVEAEFVKILFCLAEVSKCIRGFFFLGQRGLTSDVE